MTARRMFLLSGLLAGTAFAIGTLVFQGSIPKAVADDSLHTTSLALATKDYGFGSGSQSVIVASFESTDMDDHKTQITIHVRPYGSSERAVFGGFSTRDDGALWQELSCPAGAYSASGTIWRVVYEAYDSGGDMNWSYERQLTVP
jgi:hypothetical protein